MKSPASIAAVGTKLKRSAGVSRSRVLIRAEEEQAVRRNGTTKRAAELVAAQAVTLAFTGGWVNRVERVGRVEAVIADELEQVAMKQVRALTWSRR